MTRMRRIGADQRGEGEEKIDLPLFLSFVSCLIRANPPHLRHPRSMVYSVSERRESVISQHPFYKSPAPSWFSRSGAVSIPQEGCSCLEMRSWRSIPTGNSVLTKSLLTTSTPSPPVTPPTARLCSV